MFIPHRSQVLKAFYAIAGLTLLVYILRGLSVLAFLPGGFIVLLGLLTLGVGIWTSLLYLR
jgi:hypothetical protein